MDTLKELEGKVKAGAGPKESAEILVNGLADQLDALTQDPVAIKALATALRADVSAMAEAVVSGEKAESGHHTSHKKK